jgi:hypothetical protein
MDMAPLPSRHGQVPRAIPQVGSSLIDKQSFVNLILRCSDPEVRQREMKAFMHSRGQWRWAADSDLPADIVSEILQPRCVA